EVALPIIRKPPELTEVRATSELWTTSAVSAEEPEASSIVADAATPAMESVTASEIEPIGLEQAIAQMTTPTEKPAVKPVVAEVATMPAMEPVAASEIEPIRQEQPIPHETPIAKEPGTDAVVAEAATTPAIEPIVGSEIEPIGQEQAISQLQPPAEEPAAVPVVTEAATAPAMEPVAAPEIEPIRQEQAIPQQTPVSAIGPSIVEAINDTPSHHLPSATANERVTPQITTAPTMPEHLEMTAVPT